MRDKWNALTSWRTQTDGQMDKSGHGNNPSLRCHCHRCRTEGEGQVKTGRKGSKRTGHTYFLESMDGRTSAGPACVSSRGLVSRLGVRGQVTLPEQKQHARGRGVASERGKRESERGMCEWGSWAAATAHARHE